MRDWFKWFWCALRAHPYPHKHDDEMYQAWLHGDEPFPPIPYCSHCGAEIKQHHGGMDS